MNSLRILQLIFILTFAASAAGGIQYFDDTLSVSVSSVPLVFGESDNSGAGNLWRIPLDGGKLRFDVSTSSGFGTYLTPLTMHSSGHVGVSKNTPAAALHVGGSNPEIRFEYNGTEQYYGSLRWSGLQFGNNGANRIVAGRTTAGGWLEFFVNNTNEAANYQDDPSGILAMILTANGNVGIGTASPQNRLDVNGTIRAKEVIVESGWADHVFADGYALSPLSEVGDYIAKHRRLPGIPSAQEVQACGLSLGEAQAAMMAKIEELTLYAIEKDKRIELLEERLSRLEAQVSQD